MPTRRNVKIQPYMFRRGLADIIGSRTLNLAFPGHGRNTTTRQMDAYNDRHARRFSSSQQNSATALVCGVGTIGE